MEIDMDSLTAEAKAKVLGKLFSKLLDNLRHATLLLDEINRAAPNAKMRQEAFDSLELAHQDILKWRRASK